MQKKKTYYLITKVNLLKFCIILLIMVLIMVCEGSNPSLLLGKIANFKSHMQQKHLGRIQINSKNNLKRFTSAFADTFGL